MPTLKTNIVQALLENQTGRQRARCRIIMGLLIAMLHPCALSAKVPPGPKTEIRTLHGRPTFFVDGQSFTRPLFATYVPQERYYKQMAEVGCTVFNFQTNCSACDFGFSRPTWSGPDQWDFGQMDERAHIILSAEPNGLIMPRIYIGTPQWWWERHPEEMIVLDHGGAVYQDPHNDVFNMKRPYACIASPKWRADMGEALRKTIEHMQQSDYAQHIFGYEIAALGSEEWYHMTVNQLQLGDYNPNMQAAFRKWLREKYQTDHSLQVSWRKPEITFAQVTLPDKTARLGNQKVTLRNPVTDMPVIDFYLFHSDIVADTIDYFAGIVKETSGRQKAVGAFYNYMYEFRGGPEFGHNAGSRIMRSANIDFICAPPSYYQRQLGSGAECYRRPFLPGTLHNKLWFHDNDLASFLFYDLWRKRNTPAETIAKYAAQIHPTATAKESVWLYQRAAGFVLCEGIYESYFDLHGGYFDHPQILHALRDVTRALEEGRHYDRSSVAETLILADEESLAYGGFQSDWPDHSPTWRLNRTLMEHQIPFLKAGIPFDSGLLSDLDLIDFNRYKFVVFLNTWHVGKDERRKIAERILSDDRVVLWCYAPGIFQGNTTSADSASALTGIQFDFVSDDQLTRLTTARQVLTETGQNWLRQQGEKSPVHSFGPSEKLCRTVTVVDDNVHVLAVLEDADVVTLVEKKMTDWTSLYSLTAVLTPEIVRALARSAGVHIYSENNDTFYANKSYLTLNASSAGSKNIRLPRKADIYEAIDNQLYYQDVDSFSLSLMKNETIVLRYE